MNPFDEGYMARREKQIRENYESRAIAVALLVTTVVLGVLTLILAPQSGVIGVVLGLSALGTGIGGIVMFFLAMAGRAADAAIQKEQERLLALYAQMGEKPKRNGQVRLSDDGELIPTDAEDERSTRRSGREG